MAIHYLSFCETSTGNDNTSTDATKTGLPRASADSPEQNGTVIVLDTGFAVICIDITAGPRTGKYYADSLICFHRVCVKCSRQRAYSIVSQKPTIRRKRRLCKSSRVSARLAIGIGRKDAANARTGPEVNMDSHVLHWRTGDKEILLDQAQALAAFALVTRGSYFLCATLNKRFSRKSRRIAFTERPVRICSSSVRGFAP
jgi:hypothetical protein